MGAGIFSNTALVATLAITIAAIAIGLGIALKSKRITDFGKEELFQVFITLALIGIVVSLIQGIDSTVDAVYTEYTNLSCDEFSFVSSEVHTSKAIDMSMCVCNKTLFYLDNISFNIIQTQFILGYLSKLGMNFDVISAQPFHSLTYYIDYMNNHLTLALNTKSLVVLTQVILQMIAVLAIPTLFPIGLFLRLFFPTRRLGAILIAISICFYIVFPTIMLMTFPALSTTHFDEVPFQEFNNNHNYVPQTELNRDAQLLDTINSMSRTLVDEDIISQASFELKKAEIILNTIFFYFLITLFLALVTSFVFTWEIFKLLSSPMVATLYYI